MAKKESAARGRKKAAGSRGGRAAGGARKTAPKKTARKAARKTAAKKTAKKAPARKTAKKSARAGAAKKTTARRSQAGGKQAGGRRQGGGARGGTRARKSTSRRPSGGQVSRSTSRAKWIETPDDLSGRPGETLATRNHEVIQRWAEERGAIPATTPGGDATEPRVLRFNFPGFGGENLLEVSWEDWFRTFDDRNLVFLFQERMKAGNQSNFFRFDNPEREDA